MKPHTRKTFLSSAILASAFALVIFAATFGGVRDDLTLSIFGSLVMAVASIIAAVIWSKPPPGSDVGSHDS